LDANRFVRASSVLSLPNLLKRGRKCLLMGLALAIGLHLSLSRIRALTPQVKTVKPLTTQFVKRQPRLTKPLELKKRPQPKRRQIQRKMVAVKARAERGQKQTAFQPSHVLKGLAGPRVGISRTISAQAQVSAPQVSAGMIEGGREAREVVDTSLEMLDVEALDTGQYHAMVIVDRANRRAIKGFFHLAVAYSRCIPQKDWRSGSWFPDILALPHLVEKMNEWTDIKTDIGGSFPLDSRELLHTPFVFISAHYPFMISKSEAVNFGEYLFVGGFALVEDCWANIKGDTDRALRQMLKDALRTQGLSYGRDWDFDILPNSHAIFHAYFDLDGPPVGWGGICYHRNPNANPIHEYLEGIHVDGRLAVLYSSRDYGDSWDFGVRQGLDSTREFQFGVNLIIFALTQEGSITYRLMESLQ